VIVIGTGPIGQTVADRARAAGLTVAAVERELVGGECSYWACVPSKAMLRRVTALADARRVGGARVGVTGHADAKATFARRDWWVSSWHDDGQADTLKGIGADLVRGHGRLDGARRVAVETPDGPTVTLTARHAVAVCTGSAPAFPELAGLAGARPWTNREGTDAHQVPGRLIIVGGGGVGVEMATAWHGLGAAVTLLAQDDGLLPRMEPFVGEMIARAYTGAGIDVRIGVTVTGIRRPGDAGPVTLTLEGGGELEADEVLFATGRRPLTDDRCAPDHGETTSPQEAKGSEHACASKQDRARHRPGKRVPHRSVDPSGRRRAPRLGTAWLGTVCLNTANPARPCGARPADDLAPGP
jgi:dihydrolipoamide dehydrogenase